MIVQSLVIMLIVGEMIAMMMLQGAHLLRCKVSIDDDDEEEDGDDCSNFGDHCDSGRDN